MKPRSKDTGKRIGEVTESPLGRLVIMGLLLVVAGVILGRIIKALNLRACHPETSNIDFHVV